jgi:hypothetical protein
MPAGFNLTQMLFLAMIGLRHDLVQKNRRLVPTGGRVEAKLVLTGAGGCDLRIVGKQQQAMGDGGAYARIEPVVGGPKTA